MAFDYQEHLSHWALLKYLESLSVFKVALAALVGRVGTENETEDVKQ